MRRISSLNIPNSNEYYTGNAPIFIKKSIVLNKNMYTWNPQFICLLDAFFSSKSIKNLSDYPKDMIEKFVLFANGDLSNEDTDYDLIEQFNLYLATTKC